MAERRLLNKKEIISSFFTNVEIGGVPELFSARYSHCHDSFEMIPSKPKPRLKRTEHQFQTAFHGPL
jgi:hypothetical protein